MGFNPTTYSKNQLFERYLWILDRPCSPQPQPKDVSPCGTAGDLAFGHGETTRHHKGSFDATLFTGAGGMGSTETGQ